MNLRRTFGSITAVCLLAFATFLAVPAFGAAGPEGATPVEPGSTAAGAAAEKQQVKTEAKPSATVSRVRLGSKHVRHGTRVRVRGIVERRSDHVGIFFRPSGSKRWLRLKKLTPDRAGRYATTVKARRSGELRAISSVGTVSSPRSLRVRSRISVKPVKQYTAVGSAVLIRGAVSPAGKRRIKVVIGGPGGRTIRTRSTAKGGFKVRWKPKSSGTYRVRVFASGNGDAASDASRRIRVTGLRQTHASYFGPGLYGGPLACGGRLSPDTRGVAHKTLPCGTRVTLRYRGRTVTTRVVDRGPYVAGREFDLTAATRNDLGFGDIGSVWTDR